MGPIEQGVVQQGGIADQDGGASSWIVLSEDDRAIAAFELADSERTDSAAVLADLRDLGLELEIASGDSAGPVTRLAERLGIDAFHYRLTPAQKLELIRERQHDGETVAVIGDGVNDAPALKRAGIVPGTSVSSACLSAKASR